MKIRTASLKDARSLAEVHTASWQAAYRGIVPPAVIARVTVEVWEKKFKELISDNSAETALTEDGGRVTGYTTIGPCRDEDKNSKICGEIWGLYIEPGSWGKGYGTKLTEWALSRLRSKGYKCVTLWTFEKNRQARKFYDDAGFTSDNTKKSVFPDAPIAIRYIKNLEKE